MARQYFERMNHKNSGSSLQFLSFPYSFSHPYLLSFTYGLGSGPNLSLNSDPACIVFRSFSSFVFLGFVQRLGAGGAG
jgi:hypothetical protein